MWNCGTIVAAGKETDLLSLKLSHLNQIFFTGCTCVIPSKAECQLYLYYSVH
jgi:hypothetical protein